MSHKEIVMTALYISDWDNAIEGSETKFKQAFLNFDAEHIQEQVGQLRHPTLETFINEGLLPLGQVETREGCLIVFPNSHVHRVSAMTNNNVVEGDGMPKRRRIVCFFIVNPMHRIVSTREVAPQQLRAGGSMSLEEAFEHRLNLMNERKYKKQSFNVRRVHLCEH